MKYTFFFSLLLILTFQPKKVNGQLDKRIIGKWLLIKHIGMPNNLVKNAMRTFTFNSDSSYTLYRKDNGIIGKGKWSIKGDSLFSITYFPTNHGNSTRKIKIISKTTLIIEEALYGEIPTKSTYLKIKR